MLADCNSLLKVLKIVPTWEPDTDRKLDTLAKLCLETHGQDKLLIFTQFKDTADYLFRELERRGVERIAEVFGSMDSISDCVKRFSPVANDAEEGRLDELRVLITTDTLSEGQNLQDAHVVVNFDLPWAIIRLVQRAGRVDRIGQKAKEILCYCFLPEDGIENIIALRERLQNRLGENAELIGSDETFFEGDTINLKQAYDETMSLEETDDETDLISRAYDIWRQATKDNPALRKRIEKLPDVVYSARHSGEEKGAVVYVKTSNNQHILAQMNNAGEIVSQSQSKILNFLACESDEPTAPPADNHHELVAAAVHQVKADQSNTIGGQLGGARSIRNRVYGRLQGYFEQWEDTLFETDALKAAIDQIYHYPLKESARDRLSRQLQANIPDADLAHMVKNLHDAGDLCAMPTSDDPVEPHIICSMGLVE